MIKTLKILILMAFFAVSVPGASVAQQYYIKKKKRAVPEAQQTQQKQTPKPQVTAPRVPQTVPTLSGPPPIFAPCSSKDLANFRRINEGLDAMGSVTEQTRDRTESDQMQNYLSNPKNVQYMTDLFVRCNHLL